MKWVTWEHCHVNSFDREDLKAWSLDSLEKNTVCKHVTVLYVNYTTLGRLGPSCQSKPHNSLSKLLFSPDWTIVMLSWRAFPHVLSSLCNWSRMQQPEWSLMSWKKLTLPLSSSGYTGYNSRSHQIQGTDVCLQDHNWHCTNVPKLASSNLCALQKLAFCKWTTPCGAIPKRYQITLTDLFLDCAQLVESPDLNSNSWVFSHFQKTSKDTSFSPAPNQLILTLTYSI